MGSVSTKVPFLSGFRLMQRNNLYPIHIIDWSHRSELELPPSPSHCDLPCLNFTREEASFAWTFGGLVSEGCLSAGPQYIAPAQLYLPKYRLLELILIWFVVEERLALSTYLMTIPGEKETIANYFIKTYILTSVLCHSLSLYKMSTWGRRLWIVRELYDAMCLNRNFDQSIKNHGWLVFSADCVDQLKIDFNDTCRPINDDNKALQRFCVNLEFLLRHEQLGEFLLRHELLGEFLLRHELLGEFLLRHELLGGFLLRHELFGKFLLRQELLDELLGEFFVPMLSFF